MTRSSVPEEKESKSRRKSPFRRADLWLLLRIGYFSVLLFGFFLWKDTRIREPMLEITQDGQVLGVFPLTEDRDILIGSRESGNYNLCRIEGGKVRIVEADCPDRSCTRSLAIDRRGGTIICLPHRLVLRIKDGTGGIPDAVAE